jgi:hypothetical protein
MVIAVLYAPLAMSYMWFAFVADAPQWQHAITAAINGGEYTSGTGSISSIRRVDYLDNTLVLLIHTVLGGLALILAVHQLSARRRRRSLVQHRWVGRIYVGLMTISMGAALIFLIRAGTADYLGGNAMYLQLWSLDLSTLASGGLAIWAIRRRDVISHQAWMYLNFAFMMTAPLLRVVWILLAPVFPHHTLLDNVDMGSSMLGVLAPGGAAIAVQLSLRSRHDDSVTRAPISTYAALIAVAAASASLLALRFGQASAVVPAGVLWIPLGCSVAYTAVCLCGVHGARRARDAALELRWRWLAWGAALAPLGVVMVHLASAILWGYSAGLIAALMVGFSGSIATSFTLVVARIGGPLNSRSCGTTTPRALGHTMQSGRA